MGKDLLNKLHKLFAKKEKGDKFNSLTVKNSSKQNENRGEMGTSVIVSTIKIKENKSEDEGKP